MRPDPGLRTARQLRTPHGCGLDRDRPLLFKTILPDMLLRTLAGDGAKWFLNATLLKQIFGLLVLWFAARELWKMRHAATQRRRPPWLTDLSTGALLARAR